MQSPCWSLSIPHQRSFMLGSWQCHSPFLVVPREAKKCKLNAENVKFGAQQQTYHGTLQGSGDCIGEWVPQNQGKIWHDTTPLCIIWPRSGKEWYRKPELKTIKLKYGIERVYNGFTVIEWRYDHTAGVASAQWCPLLLVYVFDKFENQMLGIHRALKINTDKAWFHQSPWHMWECLWPLLCKVCAI